MNILLTGATGFIGSNIAAALGAVGHRVRSVSRRQGVDFSCMLTPANWMPYLEDIDAVINSAGIIAENGSQCFALLHTIAPIALFQACADAGVGRVLQISALGADERAFSAFHLSKRAADDYLRGLDLEWFVLRPSLIYGRRGKSAELFMRMARLPLLPVIGNGQQLLQPIHISDVVATVLRCISSSQTRLTLDLVGSETTTFAGWLHLMRYAQGLPRTRLLHVPPELGLALSHLGRYFNPMLQPDNLRMLQAGSRADAGPLTQFLGRPPLTIKPHLFYSDATSMKEAL